MIKRYNFKDGTRYAVIINGVTIDWRKTLKGTQRLEKKHE